MRSVTHYVICISLIHTANNYYYPQSNLFRILYAHSFHIPTVPKLYTRFNCFFPTLYFPFWSYDTLILVKWFPVHPCGQARLSVYCSLTMGSALVSRTGLEKMHTHAPEDALNVLSWHLLSLFGAMRTAKFCPVLRELSRWEASFDVQIQAEPSRLARFQAEGHMSGKQILAPVSHWRFGVVSYYHKNW